MTSPLVSAALRDDLYGEVNARLQDAARRGVTANIDRVVDDVLRQHSLTTMQAGRSALPEAAEAQLRQVLLDSFRGLGALQQLIDDPEIENIDVVGADKVFVTYAGGKRQRVGAVASSDEELADMLRKVAASLGVQERRFDLGMPHLDLQLPSGARLFATMVVTKQVCVSIRRHRFLVLGLDELVRLGSISPQMRHMFGAMVQARLNIVVSGGMDTGKTTFIRALASAVPEQERIITIEDPLELGLENDPAHPDVVAMQPRHPNVEGEGGIDMTTLVRFATRMNPSRVIVGEVRGAEIIPLLNALNQGTDGSMTSVHASSTREAFKKLAGYARQAREQLPFDVTYQLISGAVHIVVQLGKDADGNRFVSGVREVVGADATQVRSNEIFAPGPGKRAVPAARLSDETVDKLIDAGFDATVMGRW